MAKEERPWSSIPSISRLKSVSLAAYHMYLFGGMMLKLYPSSHTTLNPDSPRCPWQMAKKALRRPSDTMIYETIGGFWRLYKVHTLQPSPFTELAMSCPRSILIRSANEKDAAFSSQMRRLINSHPSLPPSVHVL